MSLGLYMDVHVPQAITDQPRRGVDVLTAIEDGKDEIEDSDLLDRARSLNRVLFTQDILFKALAEEWQREGRAFAGLLFGHQLRGTIGQYVEDLELISKSSELSEWIGRVDHLPYPRKFRA